MSDSLAVLDTLPPAADFYARYWNRRPFLVRDAIDPTVMDALIAPDELAALSMEDGVQARMVSQADWSCRFGPFDETDFDTADAAAWSLLVQNVEQFHSDTAALLGAFAFAPRWLMDDVMVSFSTAGGGIGGHVDSYHVFLVQGQGTRRWTVGRAPVVDEEYIDGLDLKILRHPVDGDTVEAGPGDVLYVPPRFAHEGTTLDDALTFSVGFLGPKLSELCGAYAQYLAGDDALDVRYLGEGLDADSAGFALSAGAVDALRAQLGGALATPAFADWLAAFFSGVSNEDIALSGERDDPIDPDAFADALRDGAGLIKPAYVKFALVPSPGGGYSLGFDRDTLALDDAALAVVLRLMTEQAVTVNDTPGLPDQATLLCALYNRQALEFADGEGR